MGFEPRISGVRIDSVTSTAEGFPVWFDDSNDFLKYLRFSCDGASLICKGDKHFFKCLNADNVQTRNPGNDADRWARSKLNNTF